MAHDQRHATILLKENRSQGGELAYEIYPPSKPGTILVPTSYTNTPVLAKRQDTLNTLNPDLVLVRAWECERRVFPNEGQIILPETPPGKVTYEITITGTIRYCWKTTPLCDWSRKITARGRADALYNTTDPYEDYRDRGVFEERHEWFRINGDPIKPEQLVDKNGRRDQFGLAADRQKHIYRRRLADARELVMACEAEEGDTGSFSASGWFTVSVTAWVTVTAPELKETKTTEKPADKGEPAIEDPQESMKRQIEASGRDCTVGLLAIADEYRSMVAKIEQYNDLDDGVKQALFQEAKAWAARQLEALSTDPKETRHAKHI